MSTRRFGLLCLLLAWGICPQTQCLAQTFDIGNAQSLKATAFNKRTKNIYALWSDSIRVFFPPEYTASKLMPVKPPERLFPLGYESICLGSTLYFVKKSGGLVYQLQGDSIRRIDRSFNHKMQINSTIFAHNDTLMLYGGYGFWSDRNIITYFSSETREWEIIPPEGSELLPRGSHNGLFVQKGTQTIIFSGLSTNTYNPLNVDEFREVWSFDLKDRSWSHLGDLTEDFHKYIEILHLGDKILFGSPNKHLWVLVDPFNNELTFYNISGNRRIVYPHQPQHNDVRSFYDEGKIFLARPKDIPTSSENGYGELVYTILDVEELLGDPLYSGQMYATKGFPMKWAGGAFGAIGALLLVFYGRKRFLEKDKLVVSHRNIRHNGKTVAIDPASLKVLNLLLRSADEVSSQKVIDLVENPTQNSAHNIRVKNQLIENLNLHFKTLLALDEDVIQSRKSEEDKRIKTYQIQRQYFKLI